MPNYMADYNMFTPDQPPKQLMPNYMGGYNVFTPPSSATTPQTFKPPLPFYQYR
jgi:hypothetical protein